MLNIYKIYLLQNILVHLYQGFTGSEYVKQSHPSFLNQISTQKAKNFERCP